MNRSRFPIEDIIERHYGLNIEYRRLRKNFDVLGCTVFNETKLPIYEPEIGYSCSRSKRTQSSFNERLTEGSEGRLRFTLAHELSHWLIHREAFCGSGTAAALTATTSLEQDPRTERQADFFASALLMPTGQVKKAFYRVHNADILAQLFEVSKQAMTIFLRNRKLAVHSLTAQ